MIISALIHELVNPRQIFLEVDILETDGVDRLTIYGALSRGCAAAKAATMEVSYSPHRLRI